MDVFISSIYSEDNDEEGGDMYREDGDIRMNKMAQKQATGVDEEVNFPVLLHLIFNYQFMLNLFFGILLSYSHIVLSFI